MTGRPLPTCICLDLGLQRSLQRLHQAVERRGDLLGVGIGVWVGFVGVGLMGMGC